MLFVKLGNSVASAYLPDSEKYIIKDRDLAQYISLPDDAVALPPEKERVALSEGGAWVVKGEKDLFEKAVTRPETKPKTQKASEK